MALCAGHLVSSSLTLSTYYPAPFGVYDELRATGASGNILLAYRGGNVAIGHDAPEATLDVNGAILSRFERFLIDGFDDEGWFWFRTSGGEPGSAFLGFNGSPGGRANSVALSPRGAWPPGLLVNHERNVGIDTSAPRRQAPNRTASGNIDANDVFIRGAAENEGKWASQIGRGRLVPLTEEQLKIHIPACGGRRATLGTFNCVAACNRACAKDIASVGGGQHVGGTLVEFNDITRVVGCLCIP